MLNITIPERFFFQGQFIQVPKMLQKEQTQWLTCC